MRAGMSAAGEAVVAWSFQPRARRAARVVGGGRRARRGIRRAGADRRAAQTGRRSRWRSAAVDTRCWCSQAVTTCSWPNARPAPTSVSRPRSAGPRTCSRCSRRPPWARTAERWLPGKGRSTRRSRRSCARVQGRSVRRSRSRRNRNSRCCRVQLRLFTLLFASRDASASSERSAPGDVEAGNARATITADGRALITTVGPTQRDGVWWSAPRASTLPLSGGTADVRELGAELRDVGSLTPLMLADGTAGGGVDRQRRERSRRPHPSGARGRGGRRRPRGAERPRAAAAQPGHQGAGSARAHGPLLGGV